MRSDISIPLKANRILNLILLAFILILIRVWYLGFVQQEIHIQQARKPQRKSVIEKVERATIRDRFNIPLSQNKIAYQVTVRYADLREIPSHRWKKDERGVKVKELIRAPYISSLSEMLAKELCMESQVIEDIIYAKASLFPHTPFVIKEGLTEREYYRIRMLQKDWIGMEAGRMSQRVYPLGKTACDVVGYMGAINSSEYIRIAEEIQELQGYIKKRELGEIVFLPPGYENPLEVRSRLKALQEKAYTINDQVGKAGIEGFFDEMLRGLHGKKMYEIDPKGNILRELPGGKKGVSGQRVFLAISAELQQYAEELLAQHESLRDIKDRNGVIIPGKTPWIKGGAIVAMDPKTGEVLALASYPRFDPNDFSSDKRLEVKKEKQKSVCRWLENETHIGGIWDGKTVLSRELFSQSESVWKEEIQPFTWDYFLSSILSPGSSLEKAILQMDTVKKAYVLLKHFELIRESIGVAEASPIIEVLYGDKNHVMGRKKPNPDLLNLTQNRILALKEELHESFSYLDEYLDSIRHNDDKILFLDLLGLLISTDLLDDSLVDRIGHISLSHFLELSQSLKRIHDQVKEKAEKLHHEIGFKEWRATHFKAFLREKRKEEKLQKKHAKPYIEYLERIEKSLFKNFWGTCKFFFLDAVICQSQRAFSTDYPELEPYLQVLISEQESFFKTDVTRLQHILKMLDPVQSVQCMKSMRSFEELEKPLYGRYRQIRNTKGVQLQKHLAAAFYPLGGFGYGRSQAFRQSTPVGSVFKIAIAYEALRERYEHLKENHLSLQELNPLTIIDQIQMNFPLGSSKQILGYNQDGEVIRRFYKGGTLPRTHPNIGKIDLIGAIEQSSNIYFSLLAAEHVADPSLLEKATRELGFGSKTGIELPGEIPGSIPTDLADNKTGLYLFAIGQHALVVTPLQTASMLSVFANQGDLLKPQIISLTAGKKTTEDPFSIVLEREYPFQEPLALAGLEFPLFTESILPSYNPIIHKTEAEVKRSLFLPKEIRNLLLEGMDQVIRGSKGTARPSLIRYFKHCPKAVKEYQEIKDYFLGKTGTAEFFYKPWLDAESKVEIRNHIWFGGIVFPDEIDLSKDVDVGELVVVVYLRFSQAGGKEATPLAAQVAAKWREIQKNNGSSSYLEKISSIEKKEFSEKEYSSWKK